MKFGLLFRPQDPPAAKNLTRRWQEILAAGKLAEEVGFDGLFLPEHHMMDDGYPPAPLVGLGALAAVTDGSTSARRSCCCRSTTRCRSPSTPPWWT